MNGQRFRQHGTLATVDIVRSNQWLKYSHMHCETESLLYAAQEQTLATYYVHRNIWNLNYNSKCRMCKVHDKNIDHIVSGCTMMAGTIYTSGHDKVCKYVH